MTQWTGILIITETPSFICYQVGGWHHHKGSHSSNWCLCLHSSTATLVFPAIEHHQATLLGGKPPWVNQCWKPIVVIRAGGTQTWPLWRLLFIQMNPPLHTLSHSDVIQCHCLSDIFFFWTSSLDNQPMNPHFALIGQVHHNVRHPLGW